MENFTKKVSYIERDAISNGVMLSIYGVIKAIDVRQRRSRKQITEMDFENLSVHKCDEASRRMAHYLVSKHSNTFSSIFLLRGDNEKKDLKNYDNFHTVCIAKSISGRWYCSSPANYKQGHIKDLYFEGDSLDELLDELEEREGGAWPTATYILEQDTRSISTNENIGGENVTTVKIKHIKRDSSEDESFYFRPNGTFNWS